jgi:hypothetical protein
MRRTEVSLTCSATTTHAPLAALGYALRRAKRLAPLNEVSLPIKILFHQPPGEKLIGALVLILAGGRATSQVDLLLRPNLFLALA